jgi:hypothetical protein
MSLLPGNTLSESVVEATEETQPYLTYKMNVDNDDGIDGSISGFVDDLEAYEQFVYKVLNTEFEAHEIYGSAFGVELDDLFGESLIYAISEIDRRYSDALLRDDRTTSVSNFEFEQLANNKLAVSFTVGTIYGDLEESTVI